MRPRQQPRPVDVRNRTSDISSEYSCKKFPCQRKSTSKSVCSSLVSTGEFRSTVPGSPERREIPSWRGPSVLVQLDPVRRPKRRIASVAKRAERRIDDQLEVSFEAENTPRPAKRAPRKQKRGKPATRGRTAKELATKQRDISVSEFFAKNRHLLGFDNPSKALLTTVREAVDNALDACEEAGVAPELLVEIVAEGEDRYRVIVQDNGPGIVRAQVPKIFGQLLYGSKFHTLKQARGQQGIGISAAGMYGMLTSGRPMRIATKTGPRQPAHYFEVRIDTHRNRPEILVDREVEWQCDHGTRIEITLAGTYKRGRHSVEGYLRQVAIANPHARIVFQPPSSGEEPAEPMLFERVTEELPPEPKEIKPHPYGVELGVLLKMLKASDTRNLRSFLQSEFSRVSARAADSILEIAELPERTRPAKLALEGAERLHRAMNEVKLMAPPTNCIVPIGEELLESALRQEVEADFHAVVSRAPAVYRGNPFLVEAGIAYGGDLPGDEPVSLFRYANRVPLLYQQSACAITKGVISIDWKSYQLSQARGALPAGPAVLIVHLASAWVPFTSESKEAIAHYPEILKEIRLALQECGRKLGQHINRRRREQAEGKKRSYIQKYIPHIGIALQEILKLSDPQRDKTVETLTDILERSRTPVTGRK
ncbi:MAG: DNA topoisomerase VI subunit B [Candidatus Eisenbacteria bacterium]|nr:DNA topoisomerase VI subunit B [Candidatus Latescibacterota bacterium]MBD3301184.1 DNA topoisomerase VI subunit B [Candidatus Eisenbacteria bacterium]